MHFLRIYGLYVNINIIHLVRKYASLRENKKKKQLTVQVKKKIWKWERETTSGLNTISESECFINPRGKLLIWFTWQISRDIYHRSRQVAPASCLFAADGLSFSLIGLNCSPVTSRCPCLTDVGSPDVDPCVFQFCFLLEEQFSHLSLPDGVTASWKSPARCRMSEIGIAKLLCFLVGLC